MDKRKIFTCPVAPHEKKTNKESLLHKTQNPSTEVFKHPKHPKHPLKVLHQTEHT